MSERKIYEVLFNDDDNEELGIQAISMVDSPAIKTNFIALSEQKEKQLQVKLMDDDKRLLIGPALTPNFPIPRSVSGEDFDIIFSKDTVRKCQEFYMKRYKQAESTNQHETDVEGVVTIESWLVEDSKIDKGALYGFDNTVGTWMIVRKVYNEKYWMEEVKTGNVKGFSIEGVFAPEVREELKEQITNYDAKLNEVKKLLGMV
jgi:hypothetical protein